MCLLSYQVSAAVSSSLSQAQTSQVIPGSPKMFWVFVVVLDACRIQEDPDKVLNDFSSLISIWRCSSSLLTLSLRAQT